MHYLDYKRISRRHEEILKRVNYANSIHPEGPSKEALLEEVKEVMAEFESGNKFKLVYELYDVITVCYRLLEKYEKK